MLDVPGQIKNNCGKLLTRDGLPSHNHNFYQKWLHLYLDFCHKYNHNSDNPDCLWYFIKKLQDKKQTFLLRRQASHTICLNYEFKNIDSLVKPAAMNRPNLTNQNTKGIQKFVATINKEKKLWGNVYIDLDSTIKVGHYLPITYKTYAGWVKQLQHFMHEKPPEFLSIENVKSFLTHPAVDRKVSASTHSQVFNSLLFLFRYIMKKDIIGYDGLVRAKQRRYIPLILSREKINRIPEHLPYPDNLAVKFLFGGRLRLFECMQLGIYDLNFVMMILTVQDGRGQKERTAPLAAPIINEPKQHLDHVHNLHQQDLKSGYNNTFMFGAVKIKFPNPSKKFLWQWLFPAESMPVVPETDERRCYHLPPTRDQKTIKKAVFKTKITKSATVHTFCHNFGSHLLQANNDIRTIQEFLGPSDLKTTPIYFHTVKSKTIKDAKSPLEFSL